MDFKYVDADVPIEMYKVNFTLSSGASFTVYQFECPTTSNLPFLGALVKAKVLAEEGHFFKLKAESVDGEIVGVKFKGDAIASDLPIADFKSASPTSQCKWLSAVKVPATFNAFTNTLKY